MKVLMTADTLGGVWTYALDLAQALGERGVYVVLATMGGRLSPEQTRAAASVPSMTVCEGAYRLEWMDDPWEDVTRAGDWLLEIEEAFRPDAIHVNGYVHGALPWRAPALVVAHSCVLSWWRAVKGKPAPQEWNRYNEEVTRGLRSAELVVAPTRAMLDAAAGHYGAFKRSRVIYNGRNRQIFHVRHKDPFVFAVGRLGDEAKNVAALNRVAGRLPWPVWVAGDERHPCGRGHERAGVRSAGRLSAAAMADWMGRAAIYALPARYESFGLSILEAALSGCALVLGDIPSLREVWGGAAVFVPPHDDAALAATLRALMKDRRRCEELGRRAWVHAQSYTPERMAEEYLNAYREIAVSPTPGAVGGRGIQAGEPLSRE